MSKKKSKIVRIVSVSSSFFYSITKTKNSSKLKFRKYDPITRKHEWFNEKKN